MDDDFNTADAISAVFELVKFSNTTASENSSKAYLSWLKETIEKLAMYSELSRRRKKRFWTVKLRI